jgi:hypothetical protein
MKSNYLKIIMGCTIASLFFACSPIQEPVEDCDKPKVSAINPNGDSELALLMRQLHLDADTLKQLIMNKEGNISDDFISELERSHVAIPTDPKVKTTEFKAYNELIVNQAKILRETAEENKVEEFNKLVTNCVNCHKRFCPGPVETIMKLNIVNPI